MGSGGYCPGGFEGGYGQDQGYGAGYEQQGGAGYGQDQGYGGGYGQDQGYGFGYDNAPQGVDYRAEVAALVPAGTPMLAAILIEQGILLQEGLAQAMARQAETGDALAHVLIDLNLVAPDQLMSALQSRAALR